MIRFFRFTKWRLRIKYAMTNTGERNCPECELAKHSQGGDCIGLRPRKDGHGYS